MSFLPQRIGISSHLVLHAQGSIQCPLGMILMRKRRAEQGKDAIAQSLGDISVILMHGVHHELEGRIDDRSGLFGIEPFNQSGRAFEIGKQRRDRLALAVR
jgi:hypothetical protein